MTAWFDALRFAARRLRQRPGLAVVAILTLTLGLGANTAIFTLIHAATMRPLPVTRPGELYRLGSTLNCCVNNGLQRSYSLYSYEAFRHLEAELTEFADLAAFPAATSVMSLQPPDGRPPVSDQTAFVSANYFRMFGVAPAAGRLFAPADDDLSSPPVMVMSYRTWLEDFAADPAIIGQSFLINGVGVTLVGITERSFFGETLRVNPAGVWLPLGHEPTLRGPAASITGLPDRDWLYAVGRVTGGADPRAIGEHATRALQTWLAGQSFLNEQEREQVADQFIEVTSAATGVQRLGQTFNDLLPLLFAMSGLVLLIAIANLANLLLARADRVQASIRAALGASSRQLIRQSLAEGLLLALLGCVGAVLVSMLATRTIVALAFPASAVVPVELAPSLPILLFSIGLALVTGVAFAAAPAWAASRVDPIEALRGLAREGADRSFVPRRSLVILQVTLSLVLLTGAGLLQRSLGRLENQPMGFEAEHRFAVRADVPTTLATDPATLETIYAAMQERLEQVPGIARATYSLYSPMEGNNWQTGIAIAGRPIDPEQRESSSWNRVGPNYFETLGTRVLRGRGIRDTDTRTSEFVAVVNNAFVQQFLSDQEPLGITLGMGGAERAQDHRVVGVVEDVKYSGPDQPVKPMVFFPMLQAPAVTTPAEAQMHARSTIAGTIVIEATPGALALEPAIRRALAEAHPDVAVTRFVPMADQVAGNFRNNRLMAGLASAYGGLALLLAALGLYGVTAYGVSRRTHEFGIRMALGADARRIVLDVVRRAVVQASIGLLVGLPLAMLASRALTSQLFEVNERDPVVFGTAVAVLLLTTVMAAAVPARRAASVNPTRALRAQ